MNGVGRWGADLTIYARNCAADCHKKAPADNTLLGLAEVGGMELYDISILTLLNQRCWIGYILNFLRDAQASPTRPVPSKRMVAGSGTGAVPIVHEPLAVLK